MTIFAAWTRRLGGGAGEPGCELPVDVWEALPPGFEAVAEALASATDTGPACGVVGRSAARDGAALGEALSGLRTTFDLVRGTEPDFASTEALSVAWGEATLEFLHQLSCEDPLTGLASLQHIRTRLDEIYREAEQTGVSANQLHALVVVELVDRAAAPTLQGQFTRALQLVQVTETARILFPGGETIGRLGKHRAAVLAARSTELGGTVALLREMVAELDTGALEPRVWIEGLPGDPVLAGNLLDELARTS